MEPFKNIKRACTFLSNSTAEMFAEKAGWNPTKNEEFDFNPVVGKEKEIKKILAERMIEDISGPRVHSVKDNEDNESALVVLTQTFAVRAPKLKRAINGISQEIDTDVTVEYLKIDNKEERIGPGGYVLSLIDAATYYISSENYYALDKNLKTVRKIQMSYLGVVDSRDEIFLDINAEDPPNFNEIIYEILVDSLPVFFLSSQVRNIATGVSLSIKERKVDLLLKDSKIEEERAKVLEIFSLFDNDLARILIQA